MRQMSHSLAAASAGEPHHMHGLSYTGHDRAGRQDEPCDDLVLDHWVADRFLSGEESEANVSVAHVLGLRETGRIGIGHGNEFRERYNICHFDVAPAFGNFVAVPTLGRMRHNAGASIHNSHYHAFVNGSGKHVTNAHVSVVNFATAHSPQAVAKAGTGVATRPGTQSACQVDLWRMSAPGESAADEISPPQLTLTRVPPVADGGQPSQSLRAAGAKSDVLTCGIVGQGGAKPSVHYGQRRHQQGCAAWAGNEAGVASGPAATLIHGAIQ